MGAFCAVRTNWSSSLPMQVFSEKAFTELNEYLQLSMEQQAFSGVTGEHPLAALLVRVIPVLGHLS